MPSETRPWFRVVVDSCLRLGPGMPLSISINTRPQRCRKAAVRQTYFRKENMNSASARAIGHGCLQLTLVLENLRIYLRQHISGPANGMNNSRMQTPLHLVS